MRSTMRIRNDGFCDMQCFKTKLLSVSERSRKTGKAALAAAAPCAEDWAHILYQWMQDNVGGRRHDVMAAARLQLDQSSVVCAFLKRVNVAHKLCRCSMRIDVARDHVHRAMSKFALKLRQELLFISIAK